MSNEQIFKEVLAGLPTDFYGSVELNFHKGKIMQSKTTTSKKYNPESKTTEAVSDYSRK